MKKLTTILASMAALFCAAALTGSDLKIKNGESLAFLGDSITQQGWTNPYGYLHLVGTALKSKGVEIKIIPAGISGHKSTNMNARMERDVVKKNPVWMTLSCGVNDVWHGAHGVSLDRYKKEITSILDKADKAGIKVIVLTATMIKEDAQNELNKKLIPYNEFLRQIAKERKYLLADLNADMQKIVAESKAKNPKYRGNFLTSDGVHMAGAGNEMMARGILKQFGMTDAELDKVKEEVWKKIPTRQLPRVYLTKEEEATLYQKAKAAGLSPEQYIRTKILQD